MKDLVRTYDGVLLYFIRYVSVYSPYTRVHNWNRDALNRSLDSSPEQQMPMPMQSLASLVYKNLGPLNIVGCLMELKCWVSMNLSLFSFTISKKGLEQKGWFCSKDVTTNGHADCCFPETYNSGTLNAVICPLQLSGCVCYKQIKCRTTGCWLWPNATHWLLFNSLS
jgi:hypothetical protein